jgi:saccharopine dehydrogenase (NAD+, L-lysine-forming)
MIYGANGYTGRLVARLAAERGLRPVIAGRNAVTVGALAESLGLERAVVDLDDQAGLRAILHDVAAVALCAGPFVRTAAPVIDACLATGTHYLDVTGELPVFDAVLARGAAAADAGVALVTGAGFDVVPTDCLAALLARALPGATHLELAFHAPGGASRGTAATGLAMATEGGFLRRDGVLVAAPVGAPSRMVPFPSRPRRAGAVPWGDLVTAHHSTGIPNITVYSTLVGRSGRLTALGPKLLRFRLVRDLATRVVGRRPAGPSDATRAATFVEVWGEVRDGAGGVRAAALTGPNAYDLTAASVLAAVDRLVERPPRPGAHTPATAFGPEFLDEIGGVHVTPVAGV